MVARGRGPKGAKQDSVAVDVSQTVLLQKYILSAMQLEIVIYSFAQHFPEHIAEASAYAGCA